MANDSYILYRSHRIDNFRDLLKAMSDITSHVLADHAGRVYDPTTLVFEEPLRISLVSKTLTDGSRVYDLRLVGV
jgi:hypothetical protein